MACFIGECVARNRMWCMSWPRMEEFQTSEVHLSLLLPRSHLWSHLWVPGSNIIFKILKVCGTQMPSTFPGPVYKPIAVYRAQARL